MPRTARKQSSTGILHVMLRGIDRQRIFREDASVHKEDLFGEYVTAENAARVMAALREQLERP